jgi:hypothetical protein
MTATWGAATSCGILAAEALLAPPSCPAVALCDAPAAAAGGTLGPDPPPMTPIAVIAAATSIAPMALTPIIPRRESGNAGRPGLPGSSWALPFWRT